MTTPQAPAMGVSEVIAEMRVLAADIARAGINGFGNRVTDAADKLAAAPAADGVLVPRELLEQVDSALMWDLHRRPYRHRVAQQKLIDLIREYAPAAPRAQGEGNG